MSKRVDKNLFWDFKDQTIRGSFINQVLIGVIIYLIIRGAFNTEVADRLVKMTELISLVFFISFGGWKASSIWKDRWKCKDEEVKEVKK